MQFGIPQNEVGEKKRLIELQKFFSAIDFDIMGISCTAGSEYLLTKELLKIAKEKNSSSLTVVGGYHASAISNELLYDSKEADIVVRGDGEQAILQIINEKSKLKPDFSKVHGITYRNADRICATPTQPLCKIDDLPSMDVTLINNFESYLTIPFEASRGCPFGCAFCAESGMRNKSWRVRNPVAIADELEKISHKMGKGQRIFFYDAFFCSKEKWAVSFCDEIIKKKLDLTWSIETRADMMTSKILEMYSKARCSSISYGIESGSKVMLLRMNKTKDPDTYISHSKKILEYTNKLGLISQTAFIYGFPGETNETVAETVAYIKKIHPFATAIPAYVFVPFPGSPAWNKMNLYEKLFGTKVLIKEWWKQKINTYETPITNPSATLTGANLLQLVEKIKSSFTEALSIERNVYTILDKSLNLHSDDMLNLEKLSKFSRVMIEKLASEFPNRDKVACT